MTARLGCSGRKLARGILRASAGAASVVALAALAGCGGAGTSAAGMPSASASEEPLPTEFGSPDASSTEAALDVKAPDGIVGDCWTASDSGAFQKAACTSAHTHEVFAVRPLTYQDFAAAKKAPAAQRPDAWAEQVAGALCGAKFSPAKLAAGVKDTEVAVYSVRPRDLAAKNDASWDGAQIVCLVMRDDEKMFTKRLLKETKLLR